MGLRHISCFIDNCYLLKDFPLSNLTEIISHTFFSGFPKFASHEMLRSRDYMKDDTIYLGVKVNTTSYNVRNRIQETQGLSEGTAV